MNTSFIPTVHSFRYDDVQKAILSANSQCTHCGLKLSELYPTYGKDNCEKKKFKSIEELEEIMSSIQRRVDEMKQKQEPEILIGTQPLPKETP